MKVNEEPSFPLLPTEKVKTGLFPLFSKLPTASPWVGEKQRIQNSERQPRILRKLCQGRPGEGDLAAQRPSLIESIPSSVQRWVTTADPAGSLSSLTIYFVFWATGSLGLERTGLTCSAVFSSPRNSHAYGPFQALGSLSLCPEDDPLLKCK